MRPAAIQMWDKRSLACINSAGWLATREMGEREKPGGVGAFPHSCNTGHISLSLDATGENYLIPNNYILCLATLLLIFDHKVGVMECKKQDIIMLVIFPMISLMATTLDIS